METNICLGTRPQNAAFAAVILATAQGMLQRTDKGWNSYPSASLDLGLSTCCAVTCNTESQVPATHSKSEHVQVEPPDFCSRHHNSNVTQTDHVGASSVPWDYEPYWQHQLRWPHQLNQLVRHALSQDLAVSTTPSTSASALKFLLQVRAFAL